MDGEGQGILRAVVWPAPGKLQSLLVFDRLFESLEPGLLGEHLAPLARRVTELLEHKHSGLTEWRLRKLTSLSPACGGEGRERGRLKRRSVANFSALFAGLISKSSLKKLAGEKYFERGLDYFENGAVVQLRLGEDGISARVQGTEPCPYAVRFWMEKQELQWGCACPLGVEGAFCKHLVATGLAWLSGDIVDDDLAAPENMETIQDFLESINEQTLTELLSQRALWDESLLAELALAARASRHGGTAKQPKRKGSAALKRHASRRKPNSPAD